MSRIDKLTEWLTATPNDCFLMHALGLEYAKLEDIKSAIEWFKKVIATDANYVGTYYHLGKMYELQQQTSEAIAIYEKGIAVATLLKDNHARNELQMALDDLIDEY